MDSSLDHFGVALIAVITAMTLFDLKMILGTIMGGFLQFVFSVKKTFKSFFLIVIATWFIAFFIMEPLMNYIQLESNSPIRVVVLSLSGLISVELISLTIKLLPMAVQNKLKNKLNLGDKDV